MGLRRKSLDLCVVSSARAIVSASGQDMEMGQAAWEPNWLLGTGC